MTSQKIIHYEGIAKDDTTVDESEFICLGEKESPAKIIHPEPSKAPILASKIPVLSRRIVQSEREIKVAEEPQVRPRMLKPNRFFHLFCGMLLGFLYLMASRFMATRSIGTVFLAEKYDQMPREMTGMFKMSNHGVVLSNKVKISRRGSGLRLVHVSRTKFQDAVQLMKNYRDYFFMALTHKGSNLECKCVWRLSLRNPVFRTMICQCVPVQNRAARSSFSARTQVQKYGSSSRFYYYRNRAYEYYWDWYGNTIRRVKRISYYMYRSAKIFVNRVSYTAKELYNGPELQNLINGIRKHSKKASNQSKDAFRTFKNWSGRNYKKAKKSAGFK